MVVVVVVVVVVIVGVHCAGATVATVTAADADVGENARLTYSIEAGDDTGLFSVAEHSGLVTWSDAANESSALRVACSWTLSVKVSDHGTPTPLWTVASLKVVVDDCTVDDIVHAASPHSASDLGRLLVTDWHAFVVAVAIAACVVVVGSLITVVVALRHCRRRRRPRKNTTTTAGSSSAQNVGGLATEEDVDGEIRLKLMSTPTRGSDNESVMSACNDRVLYLLDPLSTASTVDVSHAVIRVLQPQQNHQQIHRPLQVIFALYSLLTLKGKRQEMWSLTVRLRTRPVLRQKKSVLVLVLQVWCCVDMVLSCPSS